MPLKPDNYLLIIPVADMLHLTETSLLGVSMQLNQIFTFILWHYMWTLSLAVTVDLSPNLQGYISDILVATLCM
ncbi:hypothetical protein Fmac_016744 [Flemingia macrophylla]|uniref:Uncharacterized protein n=1 Tax=Flemingia macrophylla TaxID=520843 RepID=A0ABD1MI91_9FABA